MTDMTPFEFPHEKACIGFACDCCDENDVPVVVFNDEHGTTLCEECCYAMEEAARDVPENVRQALAAYNTYFGDSAC